MKCDPDPAREVEHDRLENEHDGDPLIISDLHLQNANDFIRLNHNFCYTMTKNFKFIFLYLCLTSVNKICTIVINNVLPANREIIDALLVEVWRFLVEESLEAAFEVIVVFELPSVEEVAQRPE